MGLKSFLFETSNSPRRCFIYVMIILGIHIFELWSSSSCTLETDGPVIRLENRAVLFQMFDDDTIKTSLRAGDEVKVLAIQSSSFGQKWHVETASGEIGSIDAVYLTQIKQVITDGHDKGDTVSIRTGDSDYYYYYTNSEGEKSSSVKDRFIPVFDGWGDYQYEHSTVAGICSQSKFEKRAIGSSLKKVNSRFGYPLQLHRTADGLMAEYSWKAFDPESGKMWRPIVTFDKDSVAVSVTYTKPKSRASGFLSMLPFSESIIDSWFTSLMVRGARYKSVADCVATTSDYLYLIPLFIVTLLGIIIWILSSASLPVLVMGWLLRFPNVFKNLDDRPLKYLMFAVMLISWYFWSIIMMAWGMFPFFALVMLVVSWYAFSLAKSPLETTPHCRCPKCRHMYTIQFDHEVYEGTTYHTGREIERGRLLGERKEKWREWTEVTTHWTKGSRSWTTVEQQNRRTMARDYRTYEYLSYDVTYEVKHYREFHVCSVCGHIEETTYCDSREVDRKYQGSHASETSGETYVDKYSF